MKLDNETKEYLSNTCENLLLYFILNTSSFELELVVFMCSVLRV